MGKGRDGGATGVSGIIICLLVVLILFVALVAAAGLVLGALAYMKVEDIEADGGASSVLVGLTGDDAISGKLILPPNPQNKTYKQTYKQ